MTDSDHSRADRATDHFSSVAASYARFRPDYPEALLDWVASESPGLHRAWDCGAGNGQASLALASRFRFVVATDLSASQLTEMPAHDRVHRVAARAESAPIASSSCDAVVVAQALHWFELHAFHAEVRRVLVRGGLLAAWSYGLMRVESGSAAIDALVHRFYHDVLGPHWPPERRLVDSGYRDIAFPSPELSAPDFHMERRWTLEQLLGYVRTWSAVRAFRDAVGDDPVPAFARDLADAWGDPSIARVVAWPLVVRAARME